MGDPTNRQLRMLALVSIALSITCVAIVLYAKKTVLLKSDSTGKIFTGDIKTHLKLNSKEVKQEEPQS